MGYKQHNNPFSRKISSPLRHNVVNSQGKSWSHSHKDGKVTGMIRQGKIIKGSEDFMKRRNRAVTDPDTNTKRMESGKRATAKNYAKSYADQLARAYNMGAITGGQFLAEEYKPGKGKFELFKGGDLIDFSTRGGNIGEGGMYNVQWGEREGLVAPETQVTADEIYDMMVQGGGLVSIVDGKIVAGNPNAVRFSEEGKTGSGFDTFGNFRKTDLAEDYIPEGYMIDERSNQSRGKLSVKELLELRKQKNNPINRVMSSSPLHSNHEEMDERSNQSFNLREGYDYDEPEVTVTESEWVVDPNDPTRMIRTITTDETITGRRENLNPGGLGQGQAENWAELKEGICNGTIKGDTSICDDVQSISNTVTEYKPIEVEEETPPVIEEETPPIIEEETVEDPLFEFDLGGGRKKKKKFDFKLPDIPLPELGLGELRILQKKCGSCPQRPLIQRAILALGGGI